MQLFEYAYCKLKVSTFRIGAAMTYMGMFVCVWEQRNLHSKRVMMIIVD